MSTEPCRAIYTPNANMAVHSVVARDELYESEATEASGCQRFPRKVLHRCQSGLFYFAMPTSCCVSECHQKRTKNITPFACKGK